MPNAIFDPIPTYADDDLGRSVQANPVRIPLSRQKLFPRGESKQNIMFVVNPNSRGEGVDKSPVASGDGTLVPVIFYLRLGGINAAAGEAWFGWQAAPDASEDYTNETIALSRNADPQGFVQTIEQNIADDSADVVAEGGTGPIKRTVDACLVIASTLSGIVAMEPTLKYAAFVEESGGISLVLRSEQAGRRANFRISPDGCQVAVVAVTSQGRASTNPARIDDAETLRGWVEWLRKRE